MFRFKVTNVAQNSNENTMDFSESKEVKYTTVVTLKQIDFVDGDATLSTNMGNISLTFDGLKKDVSLGDVYELSITKGVTA